MKKLISALCVLILVVISSYAATLTDNQWKTKYSNREDVSIGVSDNSDPLARHILATGDALIRYAQKYASKGDGNNLYVDSSNSEISVDYDVIDACILSGKEYVAVRISDGSKYKITYKAMQMASMQAAGEQEERQICLSVDGLLEDGSDKRAGIKFAIIKKETSASGERSESNNLLVEYTDFMSR